MIDIPQTDGPLRLKEGDKVLCDDGTTYEITDLRLWEEPESLPTYDQTRFPELELPKAEVRRFQDEYGDGLFIRNLYETRRMEYTIYNAAMNCPEAVGGWQPHPQPAPGYLRAERGADVLALAGGSAYPGVLFRAGARFEVEAWDVYHDGEISLYRI